MKKIILVLMTLMFAMSSNAQIAYEEAKPLDNVYLGIQGGIASPLDFNSVTPFNAVAGLRLGKWFCPTFGLEVEGDAWFNDNHLADSKTIVRASYVGLNGQVNWTAIVLGYNPFKTFEFYTSTGLGWIHKYNAPGDPNYFGAKTGAVFAWNLGRDKAWQVNFSPAVFWNLNERGKVQFNKNYAQLAVFAGLTYKFKTSNGTHGFKSYDISALNDEINYLRGKLAEKPESVIVDNTVTQFDLIESRWFIFFAQNSDELTPEAIDVLEMIPSNVAVNVIGSASIEGSSEYNQELSERRADAVSDYLINKGVTVESSSGVGAQNETSGRLVVVEIVQ